MEYLVPIIVAAVGSSAISNVIIACLQRKWKKEDENKSIEKLSERIDDLAKRQDEFSENQNALIDSQKVNTIDRVRWLAKQYIDQGCITLEDKETLIEMYDCYKRLKGNGHLDPTMAEIEKLKVVSEHCYE